MGIVGDIKESASLWKKASLPYKVFLVLSAFLSFGSIASLSDVIYSWKGFILEGIQFYKNYVSIPLANLFSEFGIKYELYSMDWIIVMGLIFSSWFRGVWVNYSDPDDDLDLLSVVVTTVPVALAVIYQSYKLASPGVIPSVSNVVISLVGFALIVLFLKRQANERIAMLFPIGLAIVACLILGAINAGISKTA